ncbi:hypothetical protein ACS2BX_25810 [Bacillus cereus group sp. BceL300]|uniref:hypothetical protein n=1 Tax=Bacillus cereus group sp. BceL300 TaxID=3444985 RepID=UPI003F249465
MTNNNELANKGEVATTEGVATQQVTKVSVIHVAAETTEIENLAPEQVTFLRNWWNGIGGDTTEIPVGNALLMLDRRKVSHMVISVQESESQEEAK